MKKNKVFKVSMATLAMLISAGYVANNYQVAPTYAQSTKSVTTTSLIGATTTWKYLDNNTDPGTVDDRFAWTKAGYSDTDWKSAAGKFGAKKGALADLGDGITPNVLLNQYINGTDGDDIPAFFFKTTINVSDVDELTSLTGSLVYDDAAIVFLNGTKVASFDEPDGGFESNMAYGGSNDGTPKTGEIKINGEQLKNVIKDGENIIAVELHQGRPSSSDVYLEFSELQANYGEEIASVEQKALTLTVGEDETAMNVAWYANTSTVGSVQLAKAGAMVNGAFPSDYATIETTANQSNDNGFYYNHATMNNLEENTKYVYRIVNGEKVSDAYTFTTKDFDNSFNFILAGDPQIGASGNAADDSAGWAKTLSDSANKFDPNFILSAGDQVNTASNESQYSGYLNHDELASIPQATTIGNHDSGSNAYSQHFNLPNETTKGATTAGGDYWYVYNNTLFMDINTNSTSTAEHKAFMEEAIKANSNIRWKVVVFHHSVYSVASHAVEDSILKRREELTPVFDELGVDVVLMGHDHVYVRSNIMKGMQVTQDTSALTSVKDPDGILYVTANSASGSKYYNIKTNISTEFVAKMDQSKQRSISNIEVSENEFKVTTYLYDASSNNWGTLDTFSIQKTALVDKSFLASTIEEADKVTQEQIDTIVPYVATEFKAALANAKEVYANNEATKQEVTDATARLAKIMQFLDFKKGDKTVLQDLVTTINGLDATKYSSKTWNAMLPAMDEANKLLADENALAQDVIDVQNTLFKAYLDLRLIPNKDVLNELIHQADKLQKDKYTETSFNYLQNVLVQAKEVASNKDATSEEVAGMQEALKVAIDGLKPAANSNNQGTTNNVVNTNSSTTTNSPSKVKTGDNSELLAYGTLLFTALGCTLVALKTRKEKEEN